MNDDDGPDTDIADAAPGGRDCEFHCPARVVAVGDWETVNGPLDDDFVAMAIRIGWAPDDAEEMRCRCASKRLVQVACRHNIAWTYEEDDFIRRAASGVDESVLAIDVAELASMFGRFRVMSALVGAERQLREQLRQLGRRGGKRRRGGDSLIERIQRLAGDGDAGYLRWPSADER